MFLIFLNPLNSSNLTFNIWIDPLYIIICTQIRRRLWYTIYIGDKCGLSHYAVEVNSSDLKMVYLGRSASIDGVYGNCTDVSSREMWGCLCHPSGSEGRCIKLQLQLDLFLQYFYWGIRRFLHPPLFAHTH